MNRFPCLYIVFLPFIVVYETESRSYYSVLPSFEQFPVPNSRVFDKIS